MKTIPITGKRKLAAYNLAVRKAYNAILKEMLNLISSIEQPQLRHILTCEDNSPIDFGLIAHRLISPLIYMSLECRDLERLSIHFGFEYIESDADNAFVVLKFLRSLYKHTAVEHTAVDIEDCIETDFVCHDCSVMFELYQHDSTYTLVTLPYKFKTEKPLAYAV